MAIDMNIDNPYGVLLNEKDIQLQRKQFIEMCTMIGSKAIYRAPRPGKHYTTYSEIESNYFEPQLIVCMFNEFPDQRTMKKLGWVSELDENASIISVPYDLQDIQVGALFVLPSAVNPKQGRLFRVSKMSTIMIHPSSITCEIVPEYEDVERPAENKNFVDRSQIKLHAEEKFDID